jgi:hypothetical protein
MKQKLLLFPIVDLDYPITPTFGNTKVKRKHNIVFLPIYKQDQQGHNGCNVQDHQYSTKD